MLEVVMLWLRDCGVVAGEGHDRVIVEACGARDVGVGVGLDDSEGHGSGGAVGHEREKRKAPGEGDFIYNRTHLRIPFFFLQLRAEVAGGIHDLRPHMHATGIHTVSYGGLDLHAAFILVGNQTPGFVDIDVPPLEAFWIAIVSFRKVPSSSIPGK
jgi:hypothetical protein